MRNLTTKSLKTALHNVAMRIRMDMVLHVAFIRTGLGGFTCMWVTEAGTAAPVLWQLEFHEGRPNRIDLPDKLTHED